MMSTEGWERTTFQVIIDNLAAVHGPTRFVHATAPD